MGPVRGHKRKRKVESKAENKSSDFGFEEENGSANWWDVLPQRIARYASRSPTKSLDTFESIFKMSRKTFEYVCSLAKDHLMLKTHFTFANGKPLSLYDQVAIALRRLGTGSSLITIGESFGTHHSTVSQVTWRFVEAIEVKGLQHLKWPTTEKELTEIKSKFEKIGGFPKCCGAIATSHIVMLLSTSDLTADVWLDREENHSMLLQAIVDPDLRFRNIVTGFPGKMNESSMLQSSSFFRLCENGERLKTTESDVQEYIIGGLGFPLLSWLVTPYNQGEDLSEANKVEFDKAHSATGIVARKALARLKDVWKIIDGVMWRPDKHRLPRIILVCCILHNITIDLEDEVLDSMPSSSNHDPGYVQEVCGSITKTGSDLRDKLSVYVVGR